METAPASEPLDLAVDVRHVTTAISAPADTAAATIYTTTTTAATTADSNNAITTVEQQDNGEPGVRREEEARGVGKQDRTEEREPAR